MRDVRDGFLAVAEQFAGHQTRQRMVHGRLRWSALSMALAWSLLAAVATATRVMSRDLFVSQPVIEIVFPPNDYLLMNTDLDIEVALRPELLHGGAAGHSVCIGMLPVHAPEDLPLEKAANGFTERCYDHTHDFTNFQASGLVPGIKYAVSAGFLHRGKVVGVSMRTFEVASIIAQTPDEVIRMSIAEAMQMGQQLHVNGDRESAVGVYRHVLEMFPSHAGALHRLGQYLFQEGQTRQAIDRILDAIELNPLDATMHASLATCYKMLDRTDEAVQAYRRALELRPSYVFAALGLGGLWRSMGKWDDAVHEFRKIVSTRVEPPPEQQILEPTHERMVVEALAWLCEIVRVTEGWHGAEKCLLQATRRFPDEVRFHIDRGHLLLFGGHFEAAMREYEAGSQLGSVHASMHVADVLEAIGNYEASIERYEQVYHNPDVRSTTVLNQVAIMMTTVLPRILPESQDAIEHERERFQRNVASVVQALDIGMPPILIDPSRIAFSTAITMNSHNCNNRELKYLLGKMYFGLFIRPGIVREEYVNSYGITPVPYHQKFRHNTEFPRPRLRVGFVSRFLLNPAVGLYMNELIPKLNFTKYEVFAFGIGLSKSVKSYEQAVQIAEHVVALPRDLRVAREEIRAHKVDLLIYPELGMDKTTYFLSLHQLAYVQAAWWGNPDTSGVPTIDYYITSEHEHKDFRDHYTETAYQMKGMGIYHAMPPLPNNTVTRDDVRQAIRQRFDVPEDFHLYLSIESLLHLHPDFDGAVKLILEQDPLAYVFLLGSSNRKNWKELLQKRVEARIGTDLAGRVLFLMDVDARQELHFLRGADAVLGSLRLTRPKAAMQAFTAGVPVVTHMGELWASRITAGFYKEMGIKEMTATTIEEYVDTAVRLATDEAFRDRMVRKVQRRRDRLSKNDAAVREWEKFFDFAEGQLARRRFRSDDDTAANGHQDDEMRGLETGSVLAQEATAGGETHAPAAEAMTCPATSLLHLW